MTVWPIDFEVLLDGASINNRIISISFKTSMCSPGGMLEIELDAGIEHDIVPYQNIVIYIASTKIFTGYTQNNIKARLPINQTLHCEDAIAKVRDTWNLEWKWESKGEPLEYWIDKWLSLAGVNYSVGGGGPSTPSKSWGFANCFDVVKELLKYVNWQLVVTDAGTIYVKSYGINKPGAFEISEILDYGRHLSDHWLRNQAIVIGRTKEASCVINSYVEALVGETRAGIVASGDIIWPGTAHMMAHLILNEFSAPWDVRTITIPGNPFIRIGSTIHLTENWENTDHYGLVTTWEWKLSKEGYTTILTLDEKCPSFWLSDAEPAILYCATEGHGVWKTFDDGKNWFDISGNDLNTELPSYAKDIHVIKGDSLIGTQDIVWAATLGGIFKTENGAPPWVNITEEYMDSTAQSIQWWGVLTDILETDKVYCLGNYFVDDWRIVIYIYISEDSGLTWTSYQVNEYDNYP